MNEDEIYSKLITVLISKGWVPTRDCGKDYKWFVKNSVFIIEKPIWDTHTDGLANSQHCMSIEHVLFRHDTCKLLWGDEWTEFIQLLALSPDRALFLKDMMTPKPVSHETAIIEPSHE